LAFLEAVAGDGVPLPLSQVVAMTALLLPSEEVEGVGDSIIVIVSSIHLIF
jgi:hypothetical protein